MSNRLAGNSLLKRAAENAAVASYVEQWWELLQYPSAWDILAVSILQRSNNVSLAAECAKGEFIWVELPK